MSTTVVQPDAEISWKQEVSQRIAEHKSRRAWSSAPPVAPARNWSGASIRAAQAAARVAARYAKAPSYSQMQAESAAVHHAAESEPPAANEIAAPAAAKTEAGAKQLIGESPTAAGPRLLAPEPPLALLEPARPMVRDRESVLTPSPTAVPASLEIWEREYSPSHWEPDPGLRPPEPIHVPVSALHSTPFQAPVSASALAVERTPSRVEYEAPPVQGKWERFSISEEPSSREEIVPVEPDLPIPANLIEFPRELVATRKMRPRRAEGPFAAARQEAQLSIFEVDPDAISTYPENSETEAAAWPEPAWTNLELEPQVHDESEPEQMHAGEPQLHQAPFRRRFAAALVDCTLIAVGFAVLALAAASRLGPLHATKALELGVASSLLLAGMLYHAIFLAMASGTPGMNFAGLSLCTFDGQIPTYEQLRSRLGAMLLSLVPVGLGLAWALFDDDHLCWHDRLSKTYLRMN